MATFGYAPGREKQFEGVDPRLLTILRLAAANAPPSISRVELFSGKTGRATGTINHPRGWASDVALYDSNGRKINDYYGNPFGVHSPKEKQDYQLYERFAQTARVAQQKLYPDLNDRFRWGGYFAGGVNPADTMHFDISGGMGKGLPPQTERWANGLSVGSLAGISTGADALGFGAVTPPSAGQQVISAELAPGTPDNMAAYRTPHALVDAPEPSKIPPGPYNADTVVSAAAAGDPKALVAALGGVQKNIVDQEGLFNVGNAGPKLASYFDSVRSIAPGAVRAAEAAFHTNAAMTDAVPPMLRPQISTAFANLGPTPMTRVPMPVVRPGQSTATAYAPRPTLAPGQMAINSELAPALFRPPPKPVEAQGPSPTDFGTYLRSLDELGKLTAPPPDMVPVAVAPRKVNPVTSMTPPAHHGFFDSLFGRNQEQSGSHGGMGSSSSSGTYHPANFDPVGGGSHYGYTISGDGSTVSWTNSSGHTYTVPRD